MPKSDYTRYASEIPAVLAWDQNYSTIGFEKAKSLALETKPNEFYKNYDISLRHKEIIKKDIEIRFNYIIESIFWQDNFNKNHNGSPADVVFNSGLIGGVSIKHGSNIIGNFGTKDLNINKPRGEDLFRYLSPIKFDTLLKKVKLDLMTSLSIGGIWTEERKLDYGKYSIAKLDDTWFELKFNESKLKLTAQQILDEVYIKKGKNEKLKGRYRRVFGDFYQENKKVYQLERDDLFESLYPQIEDLCKKTFFADPEKLSKLGGFYDKPYYVSDLFNDKIYFVSSKDLVKDKIKIEIFNKEKERSFGSGFELGCKIWHDDFSSFATIDFYVCYNGGTFNTGPVIKIQNFQSKEKLWQQIFP